MKKKRTILVALPVWLLLVGLLSVGLALAADHPVNVTPDEADPSTRRGRLPVYCAGKERSPQCRFRAGMVETATNGQHPFAAILSCSDSRVPIGDPIRSGDRRHFRSTSCRKCLRRGSRWDRSSMPWSTWGRRCSSFSGIRVRRVEGGGQQGGNARQHQVAGR